MNSTFFVMDDINYRGGAHFVTFSIANFLVENGVKVGIYSPAKVNEETRKYLDASVEFVTQEAYKNYDCVIVPFENSAYKEWAAALENIKKIQWIHIDYKQWAHKVNADYERERQIYQAFDEIVFVSVGAKESFLEIFPEYSDKCKVIHNLVDVKKIEIEAEEYIDEEIFEKEDIAALNILLVGRLEPQKDYDRMIDAAKLLRDEDIKINWYILGAGYQYDHLKARCKKFGLKNIKFIGYKKNPYPYMKRADIVGLLSEYEGFGLVVVEGMTIGTPVIATRSTGVEEIFDCKSGWLVENNIYAIVEKLKQIYENREELEEKQQEVLKYSYDNEEIKAKLFGLLERDVPKCMRKYVYEKNKENINNTIDVSVVVPVYNMENYLSECLESLVYQTLTNMEIIIVNDGSTDKSQEIIDEYAYRFSDKIRAFSIKNSGLGEARNYGVEKARGKYIGFVDSDDIVAKTMFEELLECAVRENSDCVICDYIAFWENGKEECVSSLPNNVDRFEILKYATKYGTVNAVTKLFSRELITKVRFPKGFYEDLATIPIWLSYAKKISYLNRGLYRYRQREGSITSIKNNDKRLLGVYECWDRILEKSNPMFKDEIRYAVYWSMDFFASNFLDGFLKYSKAYYDRNAEIFLGNKYIEDAMRTGKLLNLRKVEPIPKILHYCWFGKGEKNSLIQKCMESWKTYAPDFEIIEWNEDNCDINENVYVQKAYEEKKWAFVSDYFRIKALYEMGGIYVDTDMELMTPIEPYLFDDAFFAFETPIFVHAGIIGAKKGNNIIEKILRTYEQDEFKEWEAGMAYPIPRRITDILTENTNIVLNGKTQLLDCNIRIYSANKMTMNMHDGQSIANHHYEGGWLKRKDISTYNYGFEVLKHYFTWDLVHAQKQKSYISEGEQVFGNEGLDYKILYTDMLNSTCWKITKPLRLVMDFVKSIKKKS